MKFSITPRSITSATVYAKGMRRKLNGNTGREALSFGGLGSSGSGAALTFVNGESAGTLTVDGVSGFSSLTAPGAVGNAILKEEASFDWYATGFNGMNMGGEIPLGTTGLADPVAIYTTGEPLAPWNTSDDAANGAQDNKAQPWLNGLEFVLFRGDANNRSDNKEALAAVTHYLHTGHGLQYDTTNGAPKYATYGLGGNFLFTNYMNLGEPLANCYDQAAAVVTCGRLVGIDVNYKFMAPFGYINSTDLVGIPGLCNNPFFTGNLTPQLVPIDQVNRTGFGNHAFADYNGDIFDACAGPVAGDKTTTEYIRDVIDHTTVLTLYPRGTASNIVNGTISTVE